MSDDRIDLGDFTQYEIPDPLTYTFRDSDSVAFDISGLTAAFVLRRIGGAAVVKTGVGVVDIDPDQGDAGKGKVTWTAAAGDFYEPGLYVAEFVVADVQEEHRSVRIVWRTHAAVTTAADVSMMGLCELWADGDDLDKCGGIPTPDYEQVERMLIVASRVCFLLGGSRWPGVCSDTVQVGQNDGCAMPWPVDGGVALVNVGLSGLSTTKLRLPNTPVVAVSEVRINGVVLDAAAYRIVDDEALVRVDGGVWPYGGSISDAVPRIEIDLNYGSRPSELGRRAAATLARELLLSVCKPDSCRLDRRVQQITRQNVTIDAVQMPGLIDALVQGHIGLPEVDLFVAAENPSKLRREGRFVVPGVTTFDSRVR